MYRAKATGRRGLEAGTHICSSPGIPQEISITQKQCSPNIRQKLTPFSFKRPTSIFFPKSRLCIRQGPLLDNTTFPTKYSIFGLLVFHFSLILPCIIPPTFICIWNYRLVELKQALKRYSVDSIRIDDCAQNTYLYISSPPSQIFFIEV